MKTGGRRFKTKGVLVCKMKLWNSFLQDLWTLRVYRDSKRDWIHSWHNNLAGWQGFGMQMATTGTWPPSAVLSATSFSHCWRCISSRMTTLCLNNVLNPPTESQLWATKHFVAPCFSRSAKPGILWTLPTGTYLHLLAHRQTSFICNMLL